MTNAVWTLAAYAIQLGALVAIALAGAALLGVRSPRHALRFWQVVMAIALILPLSQPRGVTRLELPLFSALIAAPTAAVAPLDPAATAPGAATIIMLVIASGIIVRLLWLGVGLLRLRSIVARAVPEASLARVGDDLMRTLGIAAVVKISGELEGPATVGWRQPLVLVPPSVLGMSAAVQRAILCHELLHVKRRDWLQTIAEEIWRSLLWFHPLARAIASRLSLSREMVVDELTILTTRDRRAYAEALLAFSNPQPHVIGVTPFIGRRTLSQRISFIAEENPMSHRRALAHACLALTACLAITALAAARFPMFAPLQAQSTVFKPGPGITLPKVIREVKPKYTREAMQAKIQGSVWLEVVVTDKGLVSEVKVTKSLDKEYGLDEAAIAAARGWTFEPARKDGKPVAVQVTLELTFTLKK